MNCFKIKHNTTKIIPFNLLFFCISNSRTNVIIAIHPFRLKKKTIKILFLLLFHFFNKNPTQISPSSFTSPEHRHQPLSTNPNGLHLRNPRSPFFSIPVTPRSAARHLLRPSSLVCGSSYSVYERPPSPLFSSETSVLHLRSSLSWYNGHQKTASN